MQAPLGTLSLCVSSVAYQPQQADRGPGCTVGLRPQQVRNDAGSQETALSPVCQLRFTEPSRSGARQAGAAVCFTW